MIKETVGACATIGSNHIRVRIPLKARRIIVFPILAPLERAIMKIVFNMRTPPRGDRRGMGPEDKILSENKVPRHFYLFQYS